jgi:enoyl-CoA hydratase/carnithine racemase
VPDIATDRIDDIAVLMLNRPGRGNSVTPEVVAELGDAVLRASQDASVRGIVITGTGRVFCAGADVQEMHAVYLDSGIDGLCDYLADTWMPAVQKTVRKLWSCDKPTVAAINGAATAGGLDFALTCDARVAAPSARFAESYVNLGMVPVAGGAFLLPYTVGAPAAMKMLASGKLIDAPAALAIGLIESIEQPESLVERAADVARNLATGPHQTFAALKRIARQEAARQLETTLVDSLAANISLNATSEVRAGIIAVMEKYVA